jgi:hypothetical protein
MRKLFIKLAKQQSGSTIMVVSVALMAVLVMTGLVIDGGTIYVSKAHLQKTANAAALSGAQELTNSEAAVSSVVDNVLQFHAEQASLTQKSIEMERKISIGLNKQVPLAFSGLFGVDSATVAAHAAAEIMTMERAVGAAPLGIDDSIALKFYEVYKLKVDQTEVSTGNFGVLALGGNGAATYESNLKYGYQSELKTGDIIGTETGNIVGKTKEGVKARLTACSYLSGETHHRDCPRVLLLPVYRPYNYDSNQMKQVEITGFSYFYILEPLNEKDKTIKGMFIKRAGTGIVNPDLTNRGAFGIRLVE